MAFDDPRAVTVVRALQPVVTVALAYSPFLALVTAAIGVVQAARRRITSQTAQTT
jgi:hypothetical protein